MTLIELSAHPAAQLPVPLTRFIGREREVTDILECLGTTRLLTLTGAGGSGKTRLALEVSARASSTFARVAWTDLTPLLDANLLTQHVVAELGIVERAGVAPLTLLSESFGSDRVLLVIDNCEHLVDACADFAETLMRACPRLEILATSREALGVTSEMAWLVPPLDLDEATRLFVERAQTVLPTFHLSPASEKAVGTICQRLDCLPLAIELAAARVRVLSPEQIAQRLDDAFRLLTGGSRTALPRHRTLRATMEWSFSLLSTREQVLLRRLSVFAGSFSLESAEAVCTGDPLETDDILEGITGLLDKSMIAMEPLESQARYRLLETVRQYGAERLAEAGELDATHLRHAEYFLALVDDVAPHIVGGAIRPGLIERIAIEHDNVRSAVGYCIDAPHPELANRFVAGLFWYWYATGQFREARQLIDRTLALRGNVHPLHRGRALNASALAALAQGEYVRAIEEFEIAHALLREHGDEDTANAAQSKLGASQLLSGDVERAVRTLDTLLEHMRDVQEPNIALVFARFWRGWCGYAVGDYVLAHELTSKNAQIAREHRIATTLAHSLVTLGRIALGRDDVATACEYVAEGLELEAKLDDGWGIGLALDVVALAAARRGHNVEATRILAAVKAHRKRLAAALPGLVPAERERMLGQLRTVLGSSFDEHYEAGSALSTAEAVSVALAEAARHTTEYRAVDVNEVVTPAAEGQALLRIHALGPLEVQVGERVVESAAWGSARSRELLVYLAMHPEGRTKEQVGLSFWPDASTVQLRNSFHVTLHRLRKALGNGAWVVLSGDRYKLDPALIEDFDVAEFERALTEARRALKRQQEGAVAQLEQALALYRGDFLDGEPAGDWHVEHRERLQLMYLTALMDLGARQVADERFARAADTFRRVLARDEFHEEAMLALLKAHVAMGERSNGLRIYRRFAERLRSELDAEPGRALASYVKELGRE